MADKLYRRWAVVNKFGRLEYVFRARMPKSECMKWVVMEDGEKLIRYDWNPRKGKEIS